MLKAIDIQEELRDRPVIRDRGEHTTDAELSAAFATLSPFRDGGIFAGRFSGDSGWERHLGGDELVYILEGATQLTVITKAGQQTFELRAGMLVVVPQGCWHRFHASEPVTVLTATPQPTEHFYADDPRNPP